MMIFRRLFDFYINASIHVSLAVVALAYITVWELHLDTSPYLFLFVFFGAITGYNFVKYSKLAGIHHRSLTDSLRTIQIFSFLSFGIVTFCLFNLPVKVLWITAIFGVFTFLYSAPFFRHKNLRSLSGFKIFVVALVWAGVTVLVPLAMTELTLTLDIALTFLQRFLFVIVLTLPFEIRDLQYDLANLQTLPQRLGVQKTKFLGIFFLVLSVSLERFKDLFNETHFLSFATVCLLAGLALMVSGKKQSGYFASFWVESIPIVWMLFSLFL
ncbi:MAG: hypothetical protein E2O86_01945 [Bacteroidetes bacterium]|nr:MAG: hypothetical protein E2O86_01945 [Bacteroidota bacterium]